METLTALEDWFSVYSAEIVEACLSAVPADYDLAAAMLATGFAVKHGGYKTAEALHMWGDDEPIDIVKSELGEPTELDLDACRQILKVIQGRNVKLADFVSEWAQIEKTQSSA